MKHKRKMLGLGLLAVLALSSIFVASAGAVRSGHFTSDSAFGTTTIVGSETAPNHQLEASSASLPGVGIVCLPGAYHGTVTALTTDEVRVVPTWGQCETTPIDGKQVLIINVNGCVFKFTPRTEPGDATAGLVCPPGKAFIITAPHSGCRLTFSPQTVANAVTYDTVTENSKHAITLTVTASGISFTAHEGLCMFLPTTLNDWQISGAVTVTGTDVNSNFVSITAT